MKLIKVAIAGFGSIGQGVARVIDMEQDFFKSNSYDVRVVAISDSKSSIVNKDGLDIKKCLETKKVKGRLSDDNRTCLEIIKEEEFDILIEATPTDIETGGSGLENMREALKRKIHVITSNKGPLTVAFGELTETAKQNGCELKYEATVGGAMPVINLMQEMMAGNKINSIRGIFNGTCNYILTRMYEEKSSYEDILTEAMELGIAETDPSYDVDGIDTACKVVILANSIFGMNKTIKDVKITGITKITYEALEMSAKEDKTIKLIGEVTREGKLLVEPKLVPLGHPLAVSGTLNVAAINTNLAGEITVTGKGAGSIETASAVLSDLLYVLKKNY